MVQAGPAARSEWEGPAFLPLLQGRSSLSPAPRAVLGIPPQPLAAAHSVGPRGPTAFLENQASTHLMWLQGALVAPAVKAHRRRRLAALEALAALAASMSSEPADPQAGQDSQATQVPPE